MIVRPLPFLFVTATLALSFGACGDSTSTTAGGGAIDAAGVDSANPTTTDTAGVDTAGIDTATSTDSGPTPDIGFAPPGTGKCDYPATDLGAGKGYGEACTSHQECRYGLCLMPGDGNLINTQFGFCTRGCDCGDTTTQLTDTEKQSFVCLYPPGNQGRWRHVIPKCHMNLDECKVLSAQWTACKQLHTGGTDFTCHAE